jgi:hypothetical protein
VYHYELVAELPDASESKPLSLNDKWKRMEEAVRKVATNTNGYAGKQVGKEWFDEECEKVQGSKINSVQQI